MGQSKSNPRALLSRSRPALPNLVLKNDIDSGFQLKESVLVLPPDRVRQDDGGVTEIQVPEKAVHCPPHELQGMDPDEPGVEMTWVKVPDGVVVLRQGDQYGMEHLDYVVGLLGLCIDPGQVVLAGQKPKAEASMLMELFREDARTYLARFKSRRSETGLERVNGS